MKRKIRFSEMGRRALKWIPNTLTLCNSLCGFFAILYLLRSYEVTQNAGSAGKVFTVVAVMIFSAMVFDAMDGLAARALNAASMHGIQMDSLSDMVTFGVAPAVLVSVLTTCMSDWKLCGMRAAVVYGCSAVYLGGAALRLATYNVYAITGTKKNPNLFSGLPSPGAAAALCVLIFVQQPFESFWRAYPLFFPCYAAVLGLLMVSTIPYVHAGKFLMSVRRNRKRMILVVILAAVIAVFRAPGLAGIVTAYVLSGPIGALWNKIFGKKECEA